MAGNKNSGLRPTLTPAIQAKVVEVLECGNYRNVAARAADISERTLARWMADGKKAREGQFWEFCQAVLKAEADAEKWAVEQVWKGAATDPNHAKWYLERKHSKNWAGQRFEILLLKKHVTDLTKTVEALTRAMYSGSLPPSPPSPEASEPDLIVGGKDSDDES